MAGIMVSASTGVMNSLLGKLATLMGEEFAKLKNLRKDIKFIRDELIGMKDALEALSYLDELDPQTKRWRDIVREMSYDIEDIIDDFIQNIGESNNDPIGFASTTTESLKTSRSRHKIASQKTTGIFSTTIERLKTLRSRYNIAGQIKGIKALVLETSARRQRYKLDIPTSSNVAIDPRVTTLYENTANLVGMDAPTNELVNILTDEDNKLKMVSVVGFGGLGKTTLANVVYRRLKGTFNNCAFVSVSQKPNIPKLILSLLSQLGGTASSHDSELNVLLDQLRERLLNSRYLIVIDDIWDVQSWGFIRCAFPQNNLGSRVIVTTRIQDVAKACCLDGSGHILEMKPLSNEDSRRLFLDRIFGSEQACPHHLRDLSVEILKRCGGLPLAIISISSMLASESSNQEERWEYVRDSLGSARNLTLERMRQILNLSYKDLPSQLRTCFLYVGMYPEDYKIDRSNLERQWIAEGFISRENGQDVEKVAASYFNELVNRSLIQPVDFDDKGSVIACRVHDMMLDLILIKSVEENFFTIANDPQAITALDYNIHRLSIRMHDKGPIIFPRNISMSHVRTVMLFGYSLTTYALSELKFLRVFFTDRYGTDLDGLCNSYHLRYIHINGNSEFKMPIQSSVLQHLETLDLYSSSGREFAPHLGRVLPDAIGNMKFLRVLTGFDIANNTIGNIKGIGELANLRHLVLLCSSVLVERQRRMDALCSSLGRLSSLEYLLIVSMHNCIDDLLLLSPPPTPYRLRILLLPQDFCWFSRVPSWMGELRYLIELQCRVYELQNDGVGILAELPSLTDLVLGVIHGDGKIVFPGNTFTALKHLKLCLWTAPYLNFQPGAMPKLQRLELRSGASRSEQNEIAPGGIQHLLALKEFSVLMASFKQSDKESIESAFRSAINLHPGNPRFVYSSY